MSKLALIRFASVLTGAAVLFGLEQGLKSSLYIAVPAGVAAYVVVKVGLGLLLGVEPEKK
ncbi:MAG TPA: hypothetical protein VHV56_06215 [Pseudolabrys sp.]|jgi:hypothetical protein|nr:hypothetical protein [Pseudolabrys sp.]